LSIFFVSIVICVLCGLCMVRVVCEWYREWLVRYVVLRFIFGVLVYIVELKK